MTFPPVGSIVFLDGSASPQFTHNPIRLRVIRIHDVTTYDGWLWLDGYQLDKAGEATERRSLFLLISGIRVI